MLCLSAVVIPVMLDTSTQPSNLVRQWARLYHYGHIEMPALCVGATGLFGYIAQSMRYAQREQWSMFAIAGVTTIAMVPFTWIFMAPTNNALFRMETTPSEVDASVDLSEVQELVVRWAWLHATRSLFPMIGGVLGLIGVLRELGR